MPAVFTMAEGAPQKSQLAYKRKKQLMEPLGEHFSKDPSDLNALVGHFLAHSLFTNISNAPECRHLIRNSFGLYTSQQNTSSTAKRRLASFLSAVHGKPSDSTRILSVDTPTWPFLTLSFASSMKSSAELSSSGCVCYEVASIPDEQKLLC